MAGNAWHLGVRRQRHGRSGLEGDFWSVPAGSALHGTVKRHGRHGLFTHSMAIHGRQRSEAQGHLRTAGMASKARPDQFWPLTAGSATCGWFPLARQARHPREGRHRTSRQARAARSWQPRDRQFTAGKASPDVQGLSRHHPAGNARLKRMAPPGTAGMASLAQARQARPGHDGQAPTVTTRQARRALLERGNPRLAGTVRRCVVIRGTLRQARCSVVGFSTHGRHDALGVAG